MVTCQRSRGSRARPPASPRPRAIRGRGGGGDRGGAGQERHARGGGAGVGGRRGGGGGGGGGGRGGVPGSQLKASFVGVGWFFARSPAQRSGPNPRCRSTPGPPAAP